MGKIIYLLSPSNKTDVTPFVSPIVSQAPNKAEVAELVGVLQTFAKPALRALLQVSDALASLNYRRYRDFSDLHTKAALFTYVGPLYGGLEATTLSKADLEFSQRHLRIISGLYGLLRPMDHIRPYHLDICTRLATKRGKTLFDFWGTKITESVAAALEESGSGKGGERVIVHATCEEHLGAIQEKKLPAGTRVVQVVFQEPNGTIVAQHLKRARGLLLRFAIQHRITDLDALKAFTGDGADRYTFRPDRSSPSRLTFVRLAPTPTSKSPQVTANAAPTPKRTLTELTERPDEVAFILSKVVKKPRNGLPRSPLLTSKGERDSNRNGAHLSPLSSPGRALARLLSSPSPSPSPPPKGGSPVSPRLFELLPTKQRSSLKGPSTPCQTRGEGSSWGGKRERGGAGGGGGVVSRPGSAKEQQGRLPGGRNGLVDGANGVNGLGVFGGLGVKVKGKRSSPAANGKKLSPKLPEKAVPKRKRTKR